MGIHFLGGHGFDLLYILGLPQKGLPVAGYIKNNHQEGKNKGAGVKLFLVSGFPFSEQKKVGLSINEPRG
jgi:hypothetical protein